MDSGKITANETVQRTEPAIAGTCERCTRPDMATLVLALGGTLQNPKGEQTSFFARQGTLEVTLIGGRMLICPECNDAYREAVQTWLSKPATIGSGLKTGGSTHVAFLRFVLTLQRSSYEQKVGRGGETIRPNRRNDGAGYRPGRFGSGGVTFNATELVDSHTWAFRWD